MREDLEEYLAKIRWDERCIRSSELREILVTNINLYLSHEVDRDFICGLGQAVYEEALFEDDIQLLSASCEINRCCHTEVDRNRFEHALVCLMNYLMQKQTAS